MIAAIITIVYFIIAGVVIGYTYDEYDPHISYLTGLVWIGWLPFYFCLCLLQAPINVGKKLKNKFKQ